MCVGEELAKMLLYLFAANILIQFDVKVGVGFDCLDMAGTCGLTLSPPAHNLAFTKRL